MCSYWDAVLKPHHHNTAGLSDNWWKHWQQLGFTVVSSLFNWECHYISPHTFGGITHLMMDWKGHSCSSNADAHFVSESKVVPAVCGLRSDHAHQFWWAFPLMKLEAEDLLETGGAVTSFWLQPAHDSTPLSPLIKAYVVTPNSNCFVFSSRLAVGVMSFYCWGLHNKSLWWTKYEGTFYCEKLSCVEPEISLAMLAAILYCS